MSVMHVGRTDADNVDVIELTDAQFDAAKKRALNSLGLTYDELAEQARRREFSSPRAHMLWVAIGGQEH
ncbi:hypothetical protein EF847_01035 [Actinobacteria bacterium YIM 96077]|uniref:Uncharacterized protein n=1 Tax=Phytoactinopolyspora halophila TaxID=1981511 RepID=A0A329R083_9ACTN|nr:hypothetical protein [Phytoactinopolyspora halophila]AYY11515.1 hypothetical protein EF847_01035 [Actinobacteria bacterium YIM 96077]RAW18001.1 hypothetical protein DPM12_03970 [Phytoactinopolyspora halophila]